MQQQHQQHNPLQQQNSQMSDMEVQEEGHQPPQVQPLQPQQQQQQQPADLQIVNLRDRDLSIQLMQALVPSDQLAQGAAPDDSLMNRLFAWAKKMEDKVEQNTLACQQNREDIVAVKQDVGAVKVFLKKQGEDLQKRIEELHAADVEQMRVLDKQMEEQADLIERFMLAVDKVSTASPETTAEEKGALNIDQLLDVHAKGRLALTLKRTPANNEKAPTGDKVDWNRVYSLQLEYFYKLADASHQKGLQAAKKAITIAKNEMTTWERKVLKEQKQEWVEYAVCVKKLHDLWDAWYNGYADAVKSTKPNNMLGLMNQSFRDKQDLTDMKIFTKVLEESFGGIIPSYTHLPLMMVYWLNKYLLIFDI